MEEVVETKKGSGANKAVAARQGKIDAIMAEHGSIVRGMSSEAGDSPEQIKHRRKLFVQKTGPIKEALTKLEAYEELREVLEYERDRNMLPVNHAYKLNELEAAACDKTAICRRVPKSPGLFLSQDKECKVSSYFDRGRGKNVFKFYVERVIEPEEQIGKQLEWKIRQGFMPEAKDYPEAKTVTHCFELVENEFFKYFEIMENQEVVF